MNIDTFRRDKDRVAFMRHLLSDPNFSEVLAIVRSQSPVSYPINRVGTDQSDKAMALGAIYGYAQAIATLEFLGTDAEEEAPLVSTFTEPV